MSDPTTERIPTPAEAARLAREQGENTPFRFDRSTIVHRTPEHPVRDGIEVLSTAFNADPFDHFRWMHENAPLYWDDVEGIWAVGDVTGASLTTHGANAMGRRAVRAIALPKVLTVGSPRATVNAVYSRPEVASVGMTVEEVEQLPTSGRRRYQVNLVDIDRGYTDDIEHGVVVVDVERFTGKVLRATIVGPAAAEWIGIFTMANDHGIGLRKMYGTTHPYPAHVQAIGKIVDDFMRDTLPSLPKEWLAMTRGRIAQRFRR